MPVQVSLLSDRPAGPIPPMCALLPPYPCPLPSPPLPSSTNPLRGYQGDGKTCTPNAPALQELAQLYWSEPKMQVGGCFAAWACESAVSQAPASLPGGVQACPAGAVFAEACRPCSGRCTRAQNLG